MLNSDFHRLTALALAMAVSAHAADVSLQGESKLTGEITGMDESGAITLVSPISGKPLVLRGDQVRRVVFDAPETAEEVPHQRVELINGDILPISVTSMDEASLHVESPVIGLIKIPRDAVASLQLGVFQEKPIFSGSDDFKGWKRDSSGSRNWDIDGGGFSIDGPGMLSRDVALPEKFTIRFSFSWDAHPNFQFYFADPLKETGQRADRYFMEFSSSGLGVFRESAKRGRVPIVLVNRTSDQFAGNRMDVEIRANRSRGLLELRINGELEGRYTDPVKPIPAGTGISMASRAPRESGQKIKGIGIFEWDDRGDRHRSEERGDGTADSLIGRSGERFGGRLLGIRKDDGASVYVFKSDFQREPLELPEGEVSTVFLGGEGRRPDIGDGLILNLQGKGEMRLSSCIFEGDSVTVVHPLLGSMTFSRAGVASLERTEIPKAKAVKRK
jgi:hypothetical protein